MGNTKPITDTEEFDYDEDEFDPLTMTDDEYIEYRREQRKNAYYDDPSNFEEDSYDY